MGVVESAGMQQILSMSAAIEKVQQVQQQQPDMQGRHFAALLKEQEEQKKTEVQTSEKAEETRKLKNDRRKEDRRRERGRRHGEKKEDSVSEDNIKPGKIVDIVV